MSAVAWYLTVGLLLCAMAVLATLIRRLPLTTAVVYLPLGWLLGPHGTNVVDIDAVRDAVALQHIAQVVILISLFSAGLKLRVAPSSRMWWLALRLAYGSMAITVLLAAIVGRWLFALAPAMAILLAGILAPTDPVLASDVEVQDPYHLRSLNFALTSEAGLNDGSAFPVVLLGLSMLTGSLDAAARWRWILLDVCWASAAGLAAGYAVANIVGRSVLYLRRSRGQAIGLGYFLAPGLIAISYATGELVGAYGFLSVFACAVSLRWIELHESGGKTLPQLPLIAVDRKNLYATAADPDVAPVFLVELLLQFTVQLEQLGEVVIVVIVGVLLSHDGLQWHLIPGLLLLFVVIRPAAVYCGLLGAPMGRSDRALIAWFGIRGIGSVYYLAFAAEHGLRPDTAHQVTQLVLAAIATSIAVHGLSVTPLMAWYDRSHDTGAA
jgi:NhaP-type Na+/H+ or K+/H+ antiporter